MQVEVVQAPPVGPSPQEHPTLDVDMGEAPTVKRRKLIAQLKTLKDAIGEQLAIVIGEMNALEGEAA